MSNFIAQSHTSADGQSLIEDFLHVEPSPPEVEERDSNSHHHTSSLAHIQHPPQLTTGEFSVQQADSIARLHDDFLLFARAITQRMALIEHNVERIWGVVGSPPVPGSAGDLATTTTAAVTGAGQALCADLSGCVGGATQVGASPFELRIGEMETRGYIKTPFPDWEIHLVDTVTNELVTEEGWRVKLQLLSGNGSVVNQCVANHHTLVFPLVGGKASVSGLKFLVVSSNHGDAYEFEVSVCGVPEGAPAVASVMTPRFQIFSERLKHETKAKSIRELGPDDPLVRVPGIGKKYAAKLAEQGLHTIRHLASIDNSPASRKARLDLLNSIRRERGALTEAKLAELIREARNIVSDHDERHRHPYHVPPAAATATTSSPLSAECQLIALSECQPKAKSVLGKRATTSTGTEEPASKRPHLIQSDSQDALYHSIAKLQSLEEGNLSPLSHDLEAETLMNMTAMAEFGDFDL